MWLVPLTLTDFVTAMTQTEKAYNFIYFLFKKETELQEVLEVSPHQ